MQAAGEARILINAGCLYNLNDIIPFAFCRRQHFSAVITQMSIKWVGLTHRLGWVRFCARSSHKTKESTTVTIQLLSNRAATYENYTLFSLHC